MKHRKLIAFVIMTVIAMFLVPGRIYAAEESGNAELLSESGTGGFKAFAHEHNWKMPKTLPATAREQKKIVKCGYCGGSKIIKLPMKEMSVTLGGSAQLVNDADIIFKAQKAKCGNFTYFELNKKGKVTTKKNPAYYGKMKTKIPVSVKVYGKTYTMTVILKIPVPKVKINCKKIGASAYRFVFDYDIPGANRMKVRIDKEQAKEIKQAKEVEKYFDKNFSEPRPDKKPFINFTKGSLKKLANKMTFEIWAYYGNNRSEVLKKTVSVR